MEAELEAQIEAGLEAQMEAGLEAWGPSSGLLLSVLEANKLLLFNAIKPTYLYYQLLSELQRSTF